MFVNVDALDISGDRDFPTKSALKEQFRTHPELVVLYTTSAFEPSKEYNSDELVIVVKYSVTGPNPYTSRKWYATVEKTAKGIKVSYVGQNGHVGLKRYISP